ncbi:unnamed protein product, partial [marine sediment metagenome]
GIRPLIRKQPNLEVEIGGINLKNPVVLPQELLVMVKNFLLLLT